MVISTQAPTDGDLLSVLIDGALAGNDPHVVVMQSAQPLPPRSFVEIGP